MTRSHTVLPTHTETKSATGAISALQQRVEQLTCERDHLTRDRETLQNALSRREDEIAVLRSKNDASPNQVLVEQLENLKNTIKALQIDLE